MAGSLFTPRQLARMQATQESSMPDTATILRASKALGSSGHASGPLAPVATNIPCWVVARVLRQLIEREEGGEIRSGVRWVVIFPVQTDIRLDDVIDVTSAQFGTTFRLQVNGFLSEESDETALGIEAMLVK